MASSVFAQPSGRPASVLEAGALPAVRRPACLMGVAALALAAMMPASHAAALHENGDPLDSARWADMQKTFLPGQTVLFDPRVKVQAPSIAEDPMQVPVTVDASALPGVQEVIVFADFNPIVEVLRFYPGEARASLGFRVKLQQSTPVRAAVRTADGVWHLGGVWVTTVGGGCTAPSAASGSRDWQARLNEVNGRQWSQGEHAGRLRLRIMHPMDTGLIAGTPAFYVEELKFADVAGRPLMRVRLFEPVAENPLFTLQQDNVVGTVKVDGRDNNGNRIQAEISAP